MHNEPNWRPTCANPYCMCAVATTIMYKMYVQRRISMIIAPRKLWLLVNKNTSQRDRRVDGALFRRWVAHKCNDKSNQVDHQQYALRRSSPPMRYWASRPSVFCRWSVCCWWERANNPSRKHYLWQLIVSACSYLCFKVSDIINTTRKKNIKHLRLVYDRMRVHDWML